MRTNVKKVNMGKSYFIEQTMATRKHKLSVSRQQHDYFSNQRYILKFGPLFDHIIPAFCPLIDLIVLEFCSLTDHIILELYPFN